MRLSIIAIITAFVERKKALVDSSSHQKVQMHAEEEQFGSQLTIISIDATK